MSISNRHRLCVHITHDLHTEETMSKRQNTLLQRLSYALPFSLVALSWGAYVANHATLRKVRAIPFIANNPIISLPTDVVWLMMALVLSKHYLRDIEAPATEGLKLGLLSTSIGLTLDLVIVAWLVGIGPRHFAQLAVWLGYGELVSIPWLVGRGLEQRTQPVPR
jgi:hypothetical protein